MQNPRTAIPLSRRFWLPSASLLVSVMLLLPGLSGCASAADTTPQPKTKFSFSWDDPQHATLKITGGYTVEQGVLIAHLKDGSFVAVSSDCTADGTKLVYRLSSNQFYCATDGSTFDLKGQPVSGRATKPLTVYTVNANALSAGLFTITN